VTDHQDPPKLAIVIPAFKADFFEASLESIARQTRRDFIVYVGDDASPHDLEGICRRFDHQLPLRYTRFTSNLGQSDLVAQWERCVALSSEPWIWLFSDDDLMDPGCVAALHERIAADAGSVDLYRFDVTHIDANGEVLSEAAPFPDRLPSLEFMLARMENRLASYAQDYVFSRAAFQAQGGFQSFSAAWASDDATWIKIGRRRGIHAVRGPKVRWRLSGQNISSPQSPMAKKKLMGAVQFVAWAGDYLKKNPPAQWEPEAEVILAKAWEWLHWQRKHLNMPF
jgi:glycosyltransferase involved in cell wall biosynthesis